MSIEPPTPFPATSLLPLRAAVVALRFTAPARFGLFHHPALTAFLRHLLGEGDWENLFTLDAPESGRTQYEAGDQYRFTLIGLGGCEPLMDRLFGQLSALPASAPITDPIAPLRDNVALVGVTDLFTALPVTSSAQLQPYAQASLDEEVEIWRKMPRVRLRWLSPVRLLRAKEARGAAKGEARYCHDGADLPACLLADRTHDSLADLVRRRGGTPPPRPARPATEGGRDLFWTDFHYTDAQHRFHPMGGLLGVMELPEADPADTDLWRLRVLGQYLGIGQRRAFGWGRYQLETDAGETTLVRAAAAGSLAARAARPDNLEAAYVAIRANAPGRAPFSAAAVGVPEEDGDEWPDDRPPEGDPIADGEALAAVLERLSHRLGTGDYEVPPLNGVLIGKQDGGVRPLAIPPFFDRVAQRAVAQTLGAALESAMHHHSFGYRPGRSREGAKEAIAAAWREGYRWVYEADIDDFFDSVDHTRLHTRLRALLGDDPLVPLILGWMAAPVRYDGQLIPRAGGLPQGSPLSPLMANLMLDDFDHDLADAGFRLIRYADDFVILCKERPEAERASDAVVASLAEAGLALDPDKSGITSFEHGFRYLGYLFVNGLALDVGKPPAAAGAVPPPPPPRSWYARLLRREPRPLAREGLLPAPAEPAPPAAGPVIHLGALPPEEGTTLYVTGAPALISTRNHRLVLEREGEELVSEPWQNLAAVVLIGPHHVTTPALRAAMEQGVPVHFASGSGRYEGVLWHGRPGAGGAGLWLKQQALFADPAKALEAARSVVEARLRHQRELLRQRGGPVARLTADLDHLLAQLPRAADPATLNGLEGQGARVYFGALRELIPEPFGFDGRNRRPPRDPFNLLLSLGYSFLHAHVDTTLRVAGLFPWCGFYHQPHGRHATLASDLMEPFRHLVERAALAAIGRGQIKPEHFTRDGSGRVRVAHGTFRQFAALLSERFATPVAGLDDAQARPLTDHLHDQNRALAAWIDGTAPTFRAWRMR